MGSSTELIVQVLVILAFFIWAYSKVCHQTIKDTFLEIKELFKKG